MLDRIKNSFEKSKVGKFALPAFTAFGIASMPFAANADNHCADLEIRNGVVTSASSTAHGFSQETKKDPNVTNVGVAIVEGVDMKGYTPDQVGQHIVKQLEEDNEEREKRGEPIINAQCFVADYKSPNGSSIMYKVEGITVPYTDIGLNLIVGLSEDTFKIVKGEASLVKLANNFEEKPSTVLVASRD